MSRSQIGTNDKVQIGEIAIDDATCTYALSALVNMYHLELNFELAETLSNLPLPPQYGVVGASSVLQFKHNEAGPLMDFLFAVRLAR
jgi:hypothetical protein